MRVGFLVNQLDARGTGNAVLNYAHYNETLLGNESTIFTFADGRHDPDAIPMFSRWDIQGIHSGKLDVDILYHLKSGEDDGVRPNVDKYVVHSVFDYQPHGDRYAMISEWLGRKHNAPWVPHIVSVDDHTDSYRDVLGIPADALVFGRHGAADSFDIPFVWSAIRRATELNDDVYFVFLNTEKPPFEIPRTYFLPKTINSYVKRKFLNTCDVMLHARDRGETFGISVGEFAILGKQIMLYGGSRELAHLEGSSYIYFTEQQLVVGLSLDWRLQLKPWPQSKYLECTPEKVMAQFKEVFLDD